MSIFTKSVLPLQMLIAATFVGATISTIGRAADEPLEISKLVELGDATLKRLVVEPASWTAVHDSGGGFAYVKTTRWRDKTRLAFSVSLGEQKVDLGGIIARESVWYVTEGDKTAKYRPFEAPLELPMLYFYLSRSEPQAVTSEMLRGARLESETDGVTLFRVPLSKAQRQFIESLITKLRNLQTANPGQPLPEQTLM